METRLFQDSGKLSKHFYMLLPRGVYVVSNCYRSIYEPVFAQEVVADRETQWREIISSRANNRNCSVYASQEEYERSYLPIAGAEVTRRFDASTVTTIPRIKRI